MQAKYPNISTYSLHPGTVRTGLSARSTGWLRCFGYCFGCCYKSPEEGAETTLHVVKADREKLKDGGHYSDSELTSINKIGLNR